MGESSIRKRLVVWLTQPQYLALRDNKDGPVRDRGVAEMVASWDSTPVHHGPKEADEEDE